MLREYIKTSKRIRFDGDGYSDNWEKEAKRRKLSNNKNTPQALQVLTSKASMELFKTMGVLSETEVRARQEVELESYVMHLQIEARVLKEMVYNQVIPASVKYQSSLIKNVLGLKEIYGAAHKSLSDATSSIIEQIGENITELKKKTDAMVAASARAEKFQDTHKKAFAFCDNVKPYFDEVREHCDKLEQLVDDRLWPLTKYREILFIK